jgi:hypothetical protein
MLFEAPILLVQNKGDLVTRDSLANLIDAAAKEEGTDPEMQRMLAGVRRMRVTAKNLEQVVAGMISFNSASNLR